MDSPRRAIRRTLRKMVLEHDCLEQLKKQVVESWRRKNFGKGHILRFNATHTNLGTVEMLKI